MFGLSRYWLKGDRRSFYHLFMLISIVLRGTCEKDCLKFVEEEKCQNNAQSKDMLRSFHARRSTINCSKVPNILVVRWLFFKLKNIVAYGVDKCCNTVESICAKHSCDKIIRLIGWKSKRLPANCACKSFSCS